MTPSIIIDNNHRYLTKIESETKQIPLFPVSHYEKKFRLGVETAKTNNKNYRITEIQVNLSMTDGVKPVYELFLVYSAFVKIVYPDVNEAIIEEDLKNQALNILLDDICSIVYQVTRDAGLPFMIHTDTLGNPIYENNKVCSEHKRDIGGLTDVMGQETDIVSEWDRIDFQWLISLQWVKDEELLETVQGFLNVYTNQVGKEVLIDYESLPIYKCYYRFFTPIEYHHPGFKECAESVWPMLFQMLFGSFQAQCNVVDNEFGLPEIEFTFEGFEGRTLSSLSLDELKGLLSDLLTEALTDISVKLLDFRDASIMSNELPFNNQLIPERDFYHLFNTCVSDENASFLDTMYERIKECNIQTLLYQS